MKTVRVFVILIFFLNISFVTMIYSFSSMNAFEIFPLPSVLMVCQKMDSKCASSVIQSGLVNQHYVKNNESK